VDFSISDDFAAQRAAAEAWVAANADPAWAEEQHRTGTHHSPELHARMAADGLLGAGWPEEYGGTGVDVAYRQAVSGVLASRGILSDAFGSTQLVLRTILVVGTEEQKHSIIGAALRGDLLIALGYSEPDSGSDAAAAKTRAVRDGDEWVINGQKAFTSTVQACTHVFLLTRTDPDAPKHKGLTMFLVPTDAAGFELQPIHTLGGQRTNFTFYTDLRVPDSARIGGLNEGWSVMRVALDNEHSSPGNGQGRATLASRAATWARTTRAGDTTLYEAEPSVRERLARIAIDEEVARVLDLRVDWMRREGIALGAEGSMAKLFSTEAAQRHFGDLLELAGPTSVVEGDGGPSGGAFELGFRENVVETIRGGSSEILRDIIAQRSLGLPRSRPNS
jgi:3-oxocholest-4-en-26-oyl-CoA dehydrogenase alpha subunit